MVYVRYVNEFVVGIKVVAVVIYTILYIYKIQLTFILLLKHVKFISL